MGVDLSGFDHILTFKEYVKGNCLHIGRQGLHYAGPWADRDGRKAAISNSMLKKHNMPFTAEETVVGGDGHIEKLFKMMGADKIDSIDYSAYENATIIHDLNNPVSEELHNSYDYILDCGTIEHIFDVIESTFWDTLTFVVKSRIVDTRVSPLRYEPTFCCQKMRIYFHTFIVRV